MNYVYTRSSPPCPWCDRVKALMESYNIEWETRDISEKKETMDEFLKNGFRSVPQVFINDNHIGGFEATSEFLRGNK